MKEDVGTTPVYSMGVAERLTGLTGRQIRYWEQQGLLAPSRTTGKQRMYAEVDILKLKEIKRLLGDGLTLDRVKEHLATREAKRLRAQGELTPQRRPDRMPQGTLYNGGNRAELERLIDRKLGR